jgi:flagellar basal-body rod protein FlgB
MDLIDPLTLDLTRRALDAAALRHTAHSLNVANANVPQAPVFHVEYEQQLDAVRGAMAGGSPLSAADLPQAQLVRREAAESGRIELDEQLSQLSRNSLHYQALVKAVSKHLAITAAAINDGRR